MLPALAQEHKGTWHRGHIGQRSMEVFPASPAQTPTPLMQSIAEHRAGALQEITVSCLALLLDSTQESVFHLWQGLAGAQCVAFRQARSPHKEELLPEHRVLQCVIRESCRSAG